MVLTCRSLFASGARHVWDFAVLVSELVTQLGGEPAEPVRLAEILGRTGLTGSAI